MGKVKIADWQSLEDRKPAGALVSNTDLVIIRYDDEVSVLYGRCLHRGALLADGFVKGDNLMCGVHHWDYRFDTGVSEYNNHEVLQKFQAWIQDGGVWVDADEVREWEKAHPQPYNRDAYQGTYQDHHGAPEEPHVGLIRELAAKGLKKFGHHGPVDAMGVPRQKPRDSQILTPGIKPLINFRLPLNPTSAPPER